jgi:hypothetical protein
VRDCDPAWVARRAGVASEIIALIDRDRTAMVDGRWATG